MEGMDGSIRFESVQGQGTSFFLWLPAAGTELVTTDEAEVSALGSMSNAKVRKILIIDDDAAVLRSVGRMLAKHDVSTEVDAKKALQRCADDDYDLVLCDIMMPSMSGDQFYDAIKETLPALANRVVFMTGGVLTPSTEEFLAAVERPVLSKPINLEKLHAIVEG